MINYRPHQQSDISHRVEWLNNPKIKQYLDGKPDQKTNLARQQLWFLKYSRDASKFFLTICDDNKPIGVVGLTHINLENMRAKIFIMIGNDDYRGKGIGTKAVRHIVEYGFKKLNLHKIALEVFTENIQAIRCYRSAGFIEEGKLIDEDYFDDGFHSMLLMAIINPNN